MFFFKYVTETSFFVNDILTSYEIEGWNPTIQSFNMYGTLNLPSKVAKPNIIIPTIKAT